MELKAKSAENIMMDDWQMREMDVKPMVIHTKEKAKIHAHEPQEAADFGLILLGVI